MANRVFALLLLAAVIPAATEARAAAPAPSYPAAAQATALNSVQSLDYAVSAGGELMIRLTFLEALAEPPAVLTTYHPTTSVSFDFAPMSSAIGRKLHEINQRGVRNVLLLPVRNRTRLVVELKHAHLYETQLNGKELLITLRPPPSATGPDAQREPRHSLRDVSFEPTSGGGGRVIVELSDPSIPVDVRSQGRMLIVDFHGASLPAHLARRLDVTDFGTSVRSIDTRPIGNAVRISVETAGAAEYMAHQMSRHLLVEPRAGDR